MKFALYFLLCLASCSEPFYLQSDIAFTKKVEVIKRGSTDRWFIYEGDKFTAWISEDAGDKAILIIPKGFKGRNHQYKKTVFTIVRIVEDRDGEFITTITSSDNIDYVIKLYSRQRLGSTFIAWIPR